MYIVQYEKVFNKSKYVKILIQWEKSFYFFVKIVQKEKFLFSFFFMV